MFDALIERHEPRIFERFSVGPENKIYTRIGRQVNILQTSEFVPFHWKTLLPWYPSFDEVGYIKLSRVTALLDLGKFTTRDKLEVDISANVMISLEESEIELTCGRKTNSLSMIVLDLNSEVVSLILALREVVGKFVGDQPFPALGEQCNALPNAHIAEISGLLRDKAFLVHAVLFDKVSPVDKNMAEKILADHRKDIAVKLEVSKQEIAIRIAEIEDTYEHKQEELRARLAATRQSNELSSHMAAAESSNKLTVEAEKAKLEIAKLKTEAEVNELDKKHEIAVRGQEGLAVIFGLPLLEANQTFQRDEAKRTHEVRLAEIKAEGSKMQVAEELGKLAAQAQIGATLTRNTRSSRLTYGTERIEKESSDDDSSAENAKE